MFREKVEVLWFKRDLRVKDNPIFSRSTLPVLPIFIFDENILKDLPKNDKRVGFIFERILKLKNNLKQKKLDLAIFYGKPEEIFEFLSKNFEILNIYSSSDNDKYSRMRDKKIREKYPLQILFDSFLIQPDKILTKEGKPYKVYSFFKERAMQFLENNPQIEYKAPENLKILKFDYENLIYIKNGKIE
ncbi:MAG: deoxyribodipyrimidine photo-lyase [Thermoanaerobaculia bacterium]